MTDNIPNWVNPIFWITSYVCHGRDYLEMRNPHTFPGRIAVFCPHNDQSYNVSLADLEFNECSAETRIWVAGYLVGNEPDPPEGEDVPPDEHPNYGRWREACEEFRKTGFWPYGAPSFRTSEGFEEELPTERN